MAIQGHAQQPENKKNVVDPSSSVLSLPLVIYSGGLRRARSMEVCRGPASHLYEYSALDLLAVSEA